jgi:hypothetical protein
MKKVLFFTVLLMSGFTASAQITFGQTFVPKFIEGNSPTNNERVPFWFWAEITGLTPGATYRFYSTMDTANASATSNGAGNPYLVNMTSQTVRRTTNASLSNSAGHDSLVAGNSGTYSGWFGVEPSGNARFAPGNTVYPKIILNNGAGGTSVATRLILTNDSISVLDIDTVAFSNVDGSAMYDSVNAPPKSFVAVYDNVPTFPARPLNIGIVEGDGMNLNVVTSIATFYRNMVDTFPGRYGVIIPNLNADGVRYVEAISFSGTQLFLLSDDDGIWCSGLDTRNPNWGGTAGYLNSSFTFTASATIADTTFTTINTSFIGTSNDSNATYSWDFGDATTGTGANATHVYTNPGTYMVQVIIGNGGCSDTIMQAIVVELFTTVPFQQPTLWFSISPNPTNGELNIVTKDNHLKTIVVMNMLGETIHSQQSSGYNNQVKLEGQTPGFYFVRIKDEVTGRIGTRKIVLQ